MTEAAPDQLNCDIPELTPTQAKELIQMFRFAKNTFYIEGDPGVGKSYIINEITKEDDYCLIDRRAAGWAPDDAGGTRMPDVTTGTTTWFPPEWLTIDDGRKRCYFLDEFSAADDRVRKPLFGFLLERFLQNIKLRDDDLVVAAGNCGDTGTIVQFLDNATRGRLINIRIKTSLKTWTEDFASMNDVDRAVVAYLKMNPGYFLMTEQAFRDGLIAYGNPRAWTIGSDLIKVAKLQAANRNGELTEIDKKMLTWAIAGKVGNALAIGLMAVYDQVEQGHTLIDILEASPNNRVAMWPTSMGMLHALLYSMMAYPTTVADAHAIFDLMEDFPRNSEMQFQDMKASVREATLQKLRRLGVPADVVSAEFGDNSRKAMNAMLGTGKAFINLRNAA